MSLLRTIYPKGGLLGTMGTTVLVVLVVNSAVTGYYFSPFSNSPRNTHPDNRYDRIKIDGEAVEHWRFNEGDRAILRCITDINDYPIVVWTKDGRPVSRGMRIYEFINKGNTFLEIPRLSVRDEGNFTCAVSHELGYAKKLYRVCVVRRGAKEDCPRWWYNW